MHFEMPDHNNNDGRCHLFADSVMDFALHTLDTAGCAASWNRSAERLYGYTVGEIVGRSCELFYTPDASTHRELERELANASEWGIYDVEGWRIRKDGSQIDAHVLMTALRDEQQSGIGYAAITRNRTEQRRSLEEIHDQSRLRSILDIRRPELGDDGFQEPYWGPATVQ